MVYNGNGTGGWKYRGCTLQAMSPIDAEKVRALREKRGLTQQQLADAADIWRPRIAELETGKPVSITVETLERIARALKVSPASLLTQEKK